MNDIKKMREEFEQKIKYAEMENTFSEELEPLGIRAVVYGQDTVQKDKISLGFRSVDVCGHLTQENVCYLLNRFESTEPIKVYCGQKKDYQCLPFWMDTHRGPNDRGTILTIHWVFGVFRVGLEICIEDCASEDIRSLFRPANRCLDESEISSYGIQKTRWNLNYRENFPFLTFDGGEVVKFQGGYRRQISEGHLISIADAFKALSE